MPIHETPHELAGTTVKVDIGNGPEDYRVEDYWDRVSGTSWMVSVGNPAALNYTFRHIGKGGAFGPPLDNDVLYGKIGHFGHLVHISELI